MIAVIGTQKANVIIQHTHQQWRHTSTTSAADVVVVWFLLSFRIISVLFMGSAYGRITRFFLIDLNSKRKIIFNNWWNFLVKVSFLVEKSEHKYTLWIIMLRIGQLFCLLIVLQLAWSKKTPKGLIISN